jgi:phosphoribosylaminoimidazole-succinocarboxamide synthase
VCGVPLPEGLTNASKLPEPIYTPAAKAEMGEHDENITFERTVEMIGPELAARIRDISIAIYKAAAEIALTKGIIIADTKFEFGLDRDGTLVLMDEVLTPDSSRYWPADRLRAEPWPRAATRPATTSSSCATGWSRPRSTASPGARRRPRRACRAR